MIRVIFLSVFPKKDFTVGKLIYSELFFEAGKHAVQNCAGERAELCSRVQNCAELCRKQKQKQKQNQKQKQH